MDYKVRQILTNIHFSNSQKHTTETSGRKGLWRRRPWFKEGRTTTTKQTTACQKPYAAISKTKETKNNNSRSIPCSMFHVHFLNKITLRIMPYHESKNPPSKEAGPRRGAAAGGGGGLSITLHSTDKADRSFTTCTRRLKNYPLFKSQLSSTIQTRIQNHKTQPN